MRNTDIFQCWLKDFKFILIRIYLFMSSCEEIPTLLPLLKWRPNEIILKKNRTSIKKRSYKMKKNRIFANSIFKT